MTRDPVGEELADAARTLLGTPFRAGGRCARRGVDCVGLVALSLSAIGRDVAPLPCYNLRRSTIASLLPFVRAAGLDQVTGPHMVGDMLLLCPSAAQYHLAICSGDSIIIHAHAGLRRVVAGALPAHWPIARVWRLAS